MLYRETVNPETLDLLTQLQSLEEFKETRLVGGTALALQIGHRKSIDLDFFGKMTTSLEELTFVISEFASVQPLTSSKLMRFMNINGVKVDIVSYPYEWIDEPIVENGIVLASIKDIAAMKISAITNRGTKKDFVDLFFLLQRFTLTEILGLYSQKYSDSQLFTVIRSLTYFEDAESDPMPSMIASTNWDQVKREIQKTVESYLSSL